jgi:hypothetical protein
MAGTAAAGSLDCPASNGPLHAAARAAVPVAAADVRQRKCWCHVHHCDEMRRQQTAERRVAAQHQPMRQVEAAQERRELAARHRQRDRLVVRRGRGIGLRRVEEADVSWRRRHCPARHLAGLRAAPPQLYDDVVHTRAGDDHRCAPDQMTGRCASRHDPEAEVEYLRGRSEAPRMVLVLHGDIPHGGDDVPPCPEPVFARRAVRHDKTWRAVRHERG